MSPVCKMHLIAVVAVFLVSFAASAKRARSNELDDLMYLNRGYYRARAACEAGNLLEALNLAQTVLEGRIEMLGHDHQDTLHARRLTSAILHRLGRHEEAFELYGEQITQEETLQLCADLSGKAVDVNQQTTKQ